LAASGVPESIPRWKNSLACEIRIFIRKGDQRYEEGDYLSADVEMSASAHSEKFTILLTRVSHIAVYFLKFQQFDSQAG
jgi:hypothetical protein